MSRQRIFVGTYTQHVDAPSGRSEGIFVYDFDPVSGELRFLHSTDVMNPSYMAFSPDKRLLFTTIELRQFSGVPGGGVSAFALDAARLTLTPINAQPTHGIYPCYVSLSPSGKWALVANYASGSVTVLPIGADGRLGEAAAVVQNQGHGFDPARQASAHAHSVIFDPSGRFVLVADLGLDKILIFRLDEASGQLIAHNPPSVAAVPGAGPRHLIFHPNGRWLYLINELDSTVAVYAYDADRGRLAALQTISMLPSGFSGESLAADIHLSESGRFLYASNRGHDSIAVFAVDEVTGRLTLVEIVSSGGQKPRNFALDLSGNWLIAAHQGSDTLVTFRIDGASGRLTQTGRAVSIPQPVCVKPIALD